MYFIVPKSTYLTPFKYFQDPFIIILTKYPKWFKNVIIEPAHWQG